ncbi:MAG: double-strand break repair helicase AddA [Pseudomonadota bacterium]
MDDATRAQIGAADPAGSVWLAANAGAGKTRVLTDRVARLLLEGTPPERILCLTYTKAAAGEMQNRLFARLGEWAMLDDDTLRRNLTDLGVPRGHISPERLRRARTLFASAIETPGGLKIQTIHAFCASLLRRFPLEAGVSPAFSEMDETAIARLHLDVFDTMADDPETAPLVDGIAAWLTDPTPEGFLAQVAGQAAAFDTALDRTALADAMGIADETPETIRHNAMGPDMLDRLEAFCATADGAPGKGVNDASTLFRQAALADPETRFALLASACLTKAGEPKKTGGWPKAVKDGTHGPLIETFGDIAETVVDAKTRIAALDALAQSVALHAFAPAFLDRVAARKAAHGWLDFDDQIQRARALLTRSDMAQWVLFKLDGGVDHILVDEAQDTAPEQWDVIAALAAEFATGLGARPDVVRTLFVVGDRKQSIYRFQGADLAAFDRMRGVFERMLSHGAAPLGDHTLRHSFRSAPVILGLVDATFPNESGLGEVPRHVAFNAHMPGRVDLWPVIEPEEDEAEEPVWHAPVDRPSPADPKVKLAAQVAEAIEAMLRDRVPVTAKGVRRAVAPGDILILLQRRGALFHHIVRACKARNLDLAGADRLMLLDDLAVRDLITTLSWMATPEDDLSLATILRSPLGATDEDGLFRIAHGRPGTLWNALRESGRDSGTAEMLRDLLGVADILRPYELLQRILIRHDGRRKLLARLGAESAEAIDALLARALDYERLETASLTGFLGWLASADHEIKRQAGAGTIRVMSVHGAKGLEAPVVIVPETQTRRPRAVDGVQRLPDGPPVWMPPKAARPPSLSELADAVQAADAAERDRLLYVALTRAESWLIVAAAGEVGAASEDSWYRRVEAGMTAQGAAEVPMGDRVIRRLQSGDWTPAAHENDVPTPEPTRPDWLEAPVPEPPKPATLLSPSALPGTKALPGEESSPEERALSLARGTAVHALLEHLRGIPPERRAEAAPRILSRHAMVELDSDALLAEAIAVLEHPDLAPLFGPDTLREVPFALPAVPPRSAVAGIMDLVRVTGDRVTIVDFKSNRLVPSAPDQVPSGLLAQMGAYAMAAQAIWPDCTVEPAILWTAAPHLMVLPHDLVTAAWGAIDPAPADA